MTLNSTPTVVSYTRNREDVLLYRSFAIENGTYLDVGAHDPDVGSTTKLLYDRGWTGINVEPNPKYVRRLRQGRPRDISLQVAASDSVGELTWYEVDGNPALSTTDAELAARYQEFGRRVRSSGTPASTLDLILQQHLGSRRLDVVKIDVEGAEAKVLRGLSLETWKPRALLIEAVAPNSFTPMHHSWEPVLLSAGYRFCLFDGVNRVYAREDEPDLAARLSWPVCTLDHFVSIEERELASYKRLGRVAMAGARLIQAIVDGVRRVVPSSPRRAA